MDTACDRKREISEENSGGILPLQTPALSLSSAIEQLPWRWCKQLNNTECKGWVSCCCSPSFHSPRLMMCSEGRWSNKLQRLRKISPVSPYVGILPLMKLRKAQFGIQKVHENQSLQWCLLFQAHFSTAATACFAAHLFPHCSSLFLIKFTVALLLF